MTLEEYFDFQRPDDIRIKGHRIGIESVLEAYLDGCKQPREIVEQYPSLSLEEVYATILYYLHNKEQVGAYYHAHVEYCRNAEEEFDKNPSSVALRLRTTRSELDKLMPKEREMAIERMIEERRNKERKVAVTETAQVA